MCNQEYDPIANYDFNYTHYINETKDPENSTLKYIIDATSKMRKTEIIEF